MIPAPPTARERTTAAAVHIGGIFAPFFAPAIIWALCRGSTFVSRHARKALMEAIALKGVLVMVGAISLGYSISTLIHHYQTEWREFSIWPFLARFAIGWILLSILEAVNTALAIRDALHAFRGEWPRKRGWSRTPGLDATTGGATGAAPPVVRR